MTAKRIVMYIKKMTDFIQGILLSKQFMYYKKYYFNVYEFLEE